MFKTKVIGNQCSTFYKIGSQQQCINNNSINRKFTTSFKTLDHSYNLTKLFPIYNPNNFNNTTKSTTTPATSNSTNTPIQQTIGSGSGEKIVFNQFQKQKNSTPKKLNKSLSKFNSLSIITKHTVTFNEVKDGKDDSKLVPQISAGTPILRINHDPISDVIDLNKLGSSMNTIKASNKIQHYRLHAIIYNWHNVIECLNFESKLQNTFTLKQLMNKLANVLSNPNSDFYLGKESKETNTILNEGKTLHFAFLSREIIECISSINNPLYREMISNFSTDSDIIKSTNYDIVYKLDDELLKKHDIKI
ncbi:predicted protein [Naegleria gruberi]|uniref:Predicted protein n=1 Tax=Naegleria gruberi TaxID=5762 RepID=D2V3D5_NAEGR|nr:uncharacterized protein NAEGRDRAFT_63319 [Naegleria gruberi]EFC48618.1 predicted protein [Naegleria gruberi]|eukprot:XP_002681362.1 predicted protein [Naegleria gruberi strain NEG-M]